MKKAVIFLILLPAILFLPLKNGFFQQDEWYAFGEFIGLNSNINSISYNIFQSTYHFAPLGRLALILVFKIFSLNFTPYALTSIVLHLISTFLVWNLSYLVTKKKIIAYISSLFFAVGYNAFQGVGWAPAMIPSHLAIIFSLVSLTLFYKYLLNQKMSLLYLSILNLFISVLFKELAVGFIFFYPLLYLYKERKIKKIPSIIFLSTGFFYMVLRFLPLAFGITSTDSTVGLNRIDYLIYNFFTFPLKAFTELLVPVPLILFIIDFVFRYLPASRVPMFGTTRYDIFRLETGLEVFSIIISGVILVSVLIAYKLEKKYFKNLIFLGMFFVLINSPFFAFAPGRNGIVSIIDSRYLYFLSIGSSFIFACLVYFFSTKNKYIPALFFCILVGLNIIALEKELYNLAEEGRRRRYILEAIKRDYPNLPEKTVIFTQSDRAYYGLKDDTKIMPFQSGFGQTLLVWYYETEKFPSEFYKDNYLWDIDSQGYKEIGGRGFGYFRDEKLLNETIVKYNLPRESIIVYSWSGEDTKLNDITDEIRKDFR